MNLSDALTGRTITRVVARATQNFEEGLAGEERQPAVQMDELELWLDDGSGLRLTGAHFYDEQPSLIATLGATARALAGESDR